MPCRCGELRRRLVDEARAGRVVPALTVAAEGLAELARDVTRRLKPPAVVPQRRPKR